MHRKFFNAMYAFNIVIQAMISLVTPIALGIGAAWLLDEKANAGSWVYVVFIILGVGAGLVGMVRFVLSSMAGVERLEKEQADAERERKKQLRERSVADKNEK